MKNIENYDIYKVNGGPALAAIEEWTKKSVGAFLDREKLKEDLGTKTLITGGNNVVGAIFDEPPAGHWIKMKEGQNWYKPNCRYKEGKKIAEKMKAFESPGLEEFSILVGIGCVAFGFALFYPTFEKLKNGLVLFVPKGSKFIPDKQIRQLKLSEYYAMKGE